MGEVGGSMGRALVVKAARAGYGKSHLMGRFAEGLAGRAVVVPLTFDLESPPRWLSVLGEVVEKVHRDHGHRAGLTVLDEAARYLFARANQRLIQTRQIPCEHPAEAVAALDRNYLEMFDFANPDQVVARWFSEHFEGLAPLTSGSLAPEAGMDAERVAHWLRVLLAYAQGVGELPRHRLDVLKWSIHAATGSGPGVGGEMMIRETTASPEQEAKEKLGGLGRLLGLHRPLVFVIDHLDIFFRDGAAGLRIAYFVSELRRLLPRSLCVVCVNQDLWKATFASQLPSALEDRMSGGCVSLQGLTHEQAAALLHARLAEAGVPLEDAGGFWSRLRLDEFWLAQGGGAVSPRALLRHAAACWTRQARIVGPSRPAPLPAVPAPSPMLVVSGHGTDEGADLAQLSGEPGTPASSVLGEDTLDSISAALQAMVAEGPKAALVTGARAVEVAEAQAASGTGPFQRLREKLDRLRPGSSETSAAAGNAAARLPGSAESNGRVPSRGRLDESFAEHLGRRIAAPVPPALDLERLGRLLRFAGDHFPAVRAAELGVPGTSGTALQWRSPDAEILIGLESSTRPIFWSALTAHATARFKLNGGIPVKVIAFTEPDSISHPASAAGPGGGFALDLVSPPPDELHRLAAACDILEAMDDAGREVDPEEFSALLARNLEPFWRRLTRLSGVPA